MSESMKRSSSSSPQGDGMGGGGADVNPPALQERYPFVCAFSVYPQAQTKTVQREKEGAGLRNPWSERYGRGYAPGYLLVSHGFQSVGVMVFNLWGSGLRYLAACFRFSSGRLRYIPGGQ